MSLLTFTALPLESHRVQHAFFGREGGLSEGMYAGLNCGAGSHDNPHHVAQNRMRVAQHFGTSSAQLCTLYQIHSPDVVQVNSPTQGEIKADAMVTTMPGLVLGILTADCAPVLLADEEAGVVAAAHAGWKGAATGVIERTVEAMQEAGAVRGRITAAIGPCIAQASYEVGPDFIDALRRAGAPPSAFIKPNTKRGYGQFDLQGFVKQRLQNAGVAKVTALSMDTYANEPHFFSYRRTTHRGELDYGRQISCIALRERRGTATPYGGPERRQP
jgi:YfiH family protein